MSVSDETIDLDDQLLRMSIVCQYGEGASWKRSESELTKRLV